jgi:hypothetical protein
MGIKKLSKKLVKLGRKASTGKSGKRWVEAVFETAIGVIEERVQKRGVKPEKPSKPGAGRRTRAAAPARRKAAAEPRKPAGKLSEERARSPRSLRRAAGGEPHRSGGEIAPAVAETQAPAPAPDDGEGQTAT